MTRSNEARRDLVRSMLWDVNNLPGNSLNLPQKGRIDQLLWAILCVMPDVPEEELRLLIHNGDNALRWDLTNLLEEFLRIPDLADAVANSVDGLRRIIGNVRRADVNDINLNTTIKRIGLTSSGETQLADGGTFTWNASRQPSGTIVLALEALFGHSGELRKNLCGYAFQINTNGRILDTHGHLKAFSPYPELQEMLHRLAHRLVIELVEGVLSIRHQYENIGWVASEDGTD